MEDLQSLDLDGLRSYIAEYGMVLSGIANRLCDEIEASRKLIAVLKASINNDILTSDGERIERAFMDYDKTLGLAPAEVRA